MNAKEKLKTKTGLSVMEVLCGLGILIALVIIIVGVSKYNLAKTAKGTDGLTMTTAEKVAMVNIQGGGSVFSHPDGTEQLPNVGYFDTLTNSIVKEKPEGYNQYSIVSAGDTLYSGSPESLVIRVEYDGVTVQLRWTEDS